MRRPRATAVPAAILLVPLLAAGGWTPSFAAPGPPCARDGGPVHPCCRAPEPDDDCHISRAPCCEVGKAPAERGQVPSGSVSPRPPAAPEVAALAPAVLLPAPLATRAFVPVVPRRSTSPPVLLSKSSLLI